MNSVIFHNGTSVSAEDLNTAQSNLSDGIKSSFLDIRTYGVVEEESPKTIFCAEQGLTTIAVWYVVAYDSFGNRIVVPQNSDPALPSVSGLLPDDTGLLVHGGNKLKSATTYTLVLRYKEETEENPKKIHITTGEVLPCRIKASYALYLREDGIDVIEPGDVKLAKFSTEATREAKIILDSIDESVRDISYVKASAVSGTISNDIEEIDNTDYSGNISFQKHINSVGSGEVTAQNPHGLSAIDLGIDIAEMGKHNLYSHDDGIRTDNENSTVSALYPTFRWESQTFSEVITIAPLSDALNEMLVINGKSFLPTSFPVQKTFDFKNKTAASDVGYYLVSFNSETRNVQMDGPFDSENNSTFNTLLRSKTLFPICSVAWKDVTYSDGTTNRNLIAETFKDRRVFNQIGLKNIHTDEVFALTQFAPIANDRAYIHNAQIIGTKTDQQYRVAGKVLSISIDAGTTSEKAVNIEFLGAGPMYVKNILEQIRQALWDYDHYIAYARLTEEGFISITAPITVSVSGEACEELGFSIEANNLSSKRDDLIKEMLYYGDRYGIILFKYNDLEDVTQIDYYLGGGKHRRNIFHYTGEYVTNVEEIIGEL